METISTAAALLRSASFRTSEATAEKPLPASPARAASTAALSANRLVWKAMSLMMPRVPTTAMLMVRTAIIPKPKISLVDVLKCLRFILSYRNKNKAKTAKTPDGIQTRTKRVGSGIWIVAVRDVFLGIFKEIELMFKPKLKSMILRTLLLAFAAYCTITVSAQNYTTGNPANPADYGYLKDYLPLKDYIDHDKYPNFKLGLAVGANDYLNNSTVQTVVNGYFTETVTGNAMKMSSVVKNDGSMDFTTVTNFVNAATNAGVDVFGHTLAWHAQQPTGYLNGLIKDLPPVPFEDSDTTVWTALKSKDFTQEQSIGWSSDKTEYGYSTSFVGDGLLVHTTKVNPNSWDVQYIVMDNIPTESDVTYKMTLTVKGSAAGNIYSKLGDWGGGATATIPFTTEWEDVEIDYTSTINNSFLLFQHGDFVGDIWIKNIRFEKSVEGRMANRSCIVMNATARNENAWDNQFWIKPGTFSSGDDRKSVV